MNILFLTLTDQQGHPMSPYMGLHFTYDYDNWIHGLRTLHHNIIVYDYFKIFLELGPLKMEERLSTIVREKSIELIIIPNKMYEMGAFFLQKLRNTNIKILFVFFDDSTNFLEMNLFYLKHCDFIVTHESINALEYYSPYSVDVEFFPCFSSVAFYDGLLTNNFDRGPKLGDIAFVGANIADRKKFLDAIEEAGHSLSLFGKGWPSGAVSQSTMLHIFRDAKISLNFTKSYSSGNNKQLKARAFEILLAGGFLLSEYDEELLNYFDLGIEIDMFSNISECLEKITYYLENSSTRKAMQNRGVQKCRKLYSFESTWARYLSRIEPLVLQSKSVRVEYIVPEETVRAFIRWNLLWLSARLMIWQLGPAMSQLIYCVRELRFISDGPVVFIENLSAFGKGAIRKIRMHLLSH